MKLKRFWKRAEFPKRPKPIRSSLDRMRDEWWQSYAYVCCTYISVEPTTTAFSHKKMLSLSFHRWNPHIWIFIIFECFKPTVSIFLFFSWKFEYQIHFLFHNKIVFYDQSWILKLAQPLIKMIIWKRRAETGLLWSNYTKRVSK